MSLPWRDELRVGLCPDRLVLARRARGWRRQAAFSVRSGGGVAALRELAGRARVTVVLSSHFVRYTVLPWSQALSSAKEWAAYAQHAFADIYGQAAASWRIRVGDAGAREPRLACAVDGELLDALLAVPQIASIQPYLMTAFNARKRALARGAAWFIVQEPGRLALSLIEEGRWKLARVRQSDPGWHSSLGDLLKREAAACGSTCERVLLCAEDECDARAEGYRIEDLTLLGEPASERRHAMALH